MMKFFRKYNKHLLAISMALLLIIWLGGDAVGEFARAKPGKREIGTAATGVITQADTEQAKLESNLLQQLGLSWEQLTARMGIPEPTESDARLGTVEWILLKREARKMGVDITPERAQELLTGPAGNSGMTVEERIRQVAAQRNVPARLYYEAAADYFTVWNALQVFASVTAPAEPEMRRMARDISELATIEAVIFPAASYVDAEQQFSNDEMQKQFDEFKTAKAEGGLNFGYYLEPRVKLQYIKIDPEKIKEHLRGSEKNFERDAFRYWQENRESDSAFRWTLKEINDLKADASSNGASLPAVGTFYTDFAQAREKALDKVKLDMAKGEVDRIANTLTQKAREPWFQVAYDESGHQPAPESIKNEEYYGKMLEALPANLRYPGGVEVAATDWVTQQQLYDGLDGFSQAGVVTPKGEFYKPAVFAFDVEGLSDAPDERHRDTSLHMSQWQTFPKQLTGLDGAIYIFRVIGVQKGREPENLAEVSDKVLEDLRLVAGMDRAKEAANEFVANVGTQGLSAAWIASADLKEKLVDDGGGYVIPPPFPRDSSIVTARANEVQPIGKVTDEFIATAFRLAEEGADSKIEVVDVPAEAYEVAIHGKSVRPLYQEDYRMRHSFMQQQFARQQQVQLLSQWLNAKNIRQRNGFEYKKDA